MWTDVIEKALEGPFPIRNLSFRDQGLKRIRNNIWQAFPHLEVLDLSRNEIKSIPKGILKLGHLKRLIVSDNQLSKLPIFLNKMENLKVLDVHNNRLHKIEGLPHTLEVLNLSKNKIKIFPSKIKACSKLLHLDLSYNKLKEIPTLNNHLLSLQYLNFSHCQLQSIGLLPAKLHALFLSKNRLPSLPNNWQKLIYLQRFDIAYNPIKVETIHPENLKQVSYLDVSRTKTKWPGLLWLLEQFPNLEYSLGGLSKSHQKDLSGIIRLALKKNTPLSKAAILKLIKGKNDTDFSDQTLGLCLRSEVHPDIQAAAFRAYLKKHSFRMSRNIKGIHFAISGNVFQDIGILKTKLIQHGAFLVDKNEEADVVILGYKNWSQQLFNTPIKAINECTLTRWLDKKEGRYLSNTKDNTQFNNINRMLKSKDNATFNLAITLLKSWGTPQASLVILLEKWLHSDLHQKEKTNPVLRSYLPTEINILLESEKQSIFAFTSRGWSRRLWEVSNGSILIGMDKNI